MGSRRTRSCKVTQKSKIKKLQENYKEMKLAITFYCEFIYYVLHKRYLWDDFLLDTSAGVNYYYFFFYLEGLAMFTSHFYCK